MKPTYTTGELAVLWNVCIRTVATWCNRRWLKSYRLPGSKHRRILAADAVEFAEKNGLPMEALARG